MKRKKPEQSTQTNIRGKHDQVLSRTWERDPELIEKFYKQIINSFGYAYPAKV